MKTKKKTQELREANYRRMKGHIIYAGYSGRWTDLEVLKMADDYYSDWKNRTGETERQFIVGLAKVMP